MSRAETRPKHTAAPVLRFCGTRGFVEESSRRHRMHSALLIVYRGKRLLLDAGANWAGRLGELDPNWIALTHAHPDHAFGLRGGTHRPVYVTEETRALLAHFPVPFRIVKPTVVYRLGPFGLCAYRVVHSIRAPAVGFRIRVGGATAVYNPDLVEIENPAAALTGVDLYIGDGASLTRPIVRRRGAERFGHTSIRMQLDWCAAFGIRRAVFTHCGRGLIRLDVRELRRQIAVLAAGRLEVAVAEDGMELRLARTGATGIELAPQMPP
jgi:phosphoribosyl 1,2-cyclic phosphodiesterase